jgi:2-pyrone-4,6-dicarboxylate lactonase
LAKKLGIARGIIVQASTQGKDPKRLLEALEKLGSNFRCVGEVDYTLSDKDLAALAARGMLGSRVNHKSGEKFEWQELERYANRIASLGWHLDFYFLAKMFQQWAHKMGDLPVPLILDHFAMHGAKDSTASLLKLIDKGNCWVKISAPNRISKEPFPYADIAPLAKTLIKHAPERMLWGTDWPHIRIEGAMPDDGRLLELFHTWAGSDASRILVENPALFYSL